MRRRLALALAGLGAAAATGLASIAILVPGQQADEAFRPSIVRPAFPRGRGPTLCIDEAHHEGHSAGGTYRPFASLAAADGFVVRRNRDRLSEATLAPCRILVAVNAAGAARPHLFGLNLPLPVRGRREDPAFAADEIAAVRSWVAGGGALLLVADHYPFGSASASLARAVGVSMSGGFTSASNRDPAGRDPGQLVFSRENGLLGAHPILAGRGRDEAVGKVVTFTGQSLAAPSGTALLRLPDDAVDAVPPPPRFVLVPARGRSQALALRLGRGRVVVVGEAAALTAQRERGRRFGIAAGNDNGRFATNILRWLAGRL